MIFWCLRFPPKNERKQVNFRYHSSKDELFRSFFGGNRRHQNPFRNYLTFRTARISGLKTQVLKPISRPFRVAAAQCKQIRPERLNWPGRLESISEGASGISK